MEIDLISSSCFNFFQRAQILINDKNKTDWLLIISKKKGGHKLAAAECDMSITFTPRLRRASDAFASYFWKMI